MELMWFCLGALLIITILAFQVWIKRKKTRISWLSWIGFIITLVLGFFTIAWTISCLIEGETRAAVMGLVMFGLITAIVLALTLRKIQKDNKK